MSESLLICDSWALSFDVPPQTLVEMNGHKNYISLKVAGLLVSNQRIFIRNKSLEKIPLVQITLSNFESSFSQPVSPQFIFCTIKF